MQQFKNRYENLQSKLVPCLKEGCLFISLLYIAECYLKRNVDLIDCFNYSIKKNYLKLDGTVQDSPGILSYLTNDTWRRIILDPKQKLPTVNSWQLVEKWTRENGKNHFRPKDFEIYEKSITVSQGKLEAIYLFVPSSYL